MDDVSPTGLPLPFLEDPWKGSKKTAAQALWQWHRALWTGGASLLEGAEGGRYDLDEERKRAIAGKVLAMLPEAVSRQAYEACTAHGLPLSLLADQLYSVEHLREGLRFETVADLKAFIQQAVVPHAYLLGQLADLTGSWQLGYLDELTRAFFLVGRLSTLSEDIQRDWLFIPLDEMAFAGVTIEQLREGRVDAGMRKLLWKQAVRARDSFAQAEPLVRDLSGRMARAFKRWWLGGLEVLHEIERMDYDVFSRPVTLSAFRRIQVRLHALVGRTALKR